MGEPDLTGRTCVVTGATSGIGEETALALARMGARVAILARSPERAERTRARIQRATGREIEVVQGDLASLASIRAAAADLLARLDAIHVLVNNAGLVMTQRTTTQDGFETTFGVNHLGPFLLTHLLLDRIVASAPARIVNLASEGHRFARRGLDLEDLQNERRPYNWFRVYGESKLANILFTRELARRLAGTGVVVNAVHPGAVGTRLGVNNGLFSQVVMSLLRPFIRSPAQGARTSLHVATAPELADTTGAYFVDRRERTPSHHARDPELASALWKRSAELVGVPA